MNFADLLAIGATVNHYRAAKCRDALLQQLVEVVVVYGTWMGDNSKLRLAILQRSMRCVEYLQRWHLNLRDFS